MPKENRVDEYWRNAEGYFSTSQQRDQYLKAQHEEAQKSEREKIARLKALQLRKEAAARDCENPE
jgi:hypothetical protein